MLIVSNLLQFSEKEGGDIILEKIPRDLKMVEVMHQIMKKKMMEETIGQIACARHVFL